MNPPAATEAAPNSSPSLFVLLLLLGRGSRTVPDPVSGGALPPSSAALPKSAAGAGPAAFDATPVLAVERLLLSRGPVVVTAVLSVGRAGGGL